jgi:hypothetical protein
VYEIKFSKERYFLKDTPKQGVAAKFLIAPFLAAVTNAEKAVMNRAGHQFKILNTIESCSATAAETSLVTIV